MYIRPLSGFLLLVLIISLPVFAHLDDLPMQLWDESRLANSAIEMYETGNPIVVTYDYTPEMWSTKPPFLIWLQAISIMILGPTDLAMRMPTALSAIALFLFLYWFFYKKINALWLGIISCIVLVTVPGYVTMHVTRTADYDGMLTLFTSCSVIFFFLFMEEMRSRYFWLSVLFLILAALTKGIAGLLFLPAMFLYALYQKKLLTMLKMPRLYIGIFAFLFFVVGYYLLREQYNPGYINAVMQNELGGRYNTVLEHHAGGPWYYYDFLVNKGFKPWALFSAFGIIMGLLSTNKKIKELSVCILLLCVTYMIVISIGATKLDWYLVPIYPFLSIGAALFIYQLFQALHRARFWKGHLSYNVLPFIFLVFICLEPYRAVINYAMHPQGTGFAADDMAVSLKSYVKAYPYKESMKVMLNEYQGGVDWYMKALKLRNVPVTKGTIDSIANEELAITYEDNVKFAIENKYNAHVVSTNGRATIYQIHGKK